MVGTMAQEKNLDNKVIDFLKCKKCWCIKYWSGARYTKAGVPDILACIDGHFFGIENKAKTGRPSLLQLKNLEWIRHAGGFGILLYSDDFKNFKRFVDELREDELVTEWQFEWYSKNIDLQKEWEEKLKTS